jgi:hypothetical protein
VVEGGERLSVVEGGERRRFRVSWLLVAVFPMNIGGIWGGGVLHEEDGRTGLSEIEDAW